MNPGRFIVLEGIEGAGKSTHTVFLADWLRENGREVVTAREPGGTSLGEQLRAILLDPGRAAMLPQAELLLMFAARSASIHEVIRPALERGAWVVCDRFVDSSYAYQSAGRGVPAEQVQALERQVVGKLRADLTLVLDAPPELSLSRKAAAPGGKDCFEREGRTFFERVRDGYLERAAAGGRRYLVVDTSRPLEEVRHVLAQAARRLLLQET